MAHTLPTQFENRAKSLYDQILEEGMEKGMEKLLIAFIKKHYDWPDREIAAFFGIAVKYVKNARAIYQADQKH